MAWRQGLRSLGTGSILFLVGLLLSTGFLEPDVPTFWQDLLGKPIDFTMPLLGFVILVSVGADYNILLMSRVREESATATRAGRCVVWRGVA